MPRQMSISNFSDLVCSRKSKDNYKICGGLKALERSQEERVMTHQPRVAKLEGPPFHNSLTNNMGINYIHDKTPMPYAK